MPQVDHQNSSSDKFCLRPEHCNCAAAGRLMRPNRSKSSPSFPYRLNRLKCTMSIGGSLQISIVFHASRCCLHLGQNHLLSLLTFSLVVNNRIQSYIGIESETYNIPRETYRAERRIPFSVAIDFMRKSPILKRLRYDEAGFWLANVIRQSGNQEHAIFANYVATWTCYQRFIGTAFLTSIWQDALVGIGSVSDMNASNVTLCLLQTEQVNVDLNWPYIL